VLQSLKDFLLLCTQVELSADVLLSTTNAFHSEVERLLVSISQTTIPTFNSRKNAKFWWDEELNTLKQESISTHNTWVDAHKPRSGPIFEARNKARNKYRFRIRKSKQADRSSISLSLQNKLCEKNKTNFWKTWKSKFKNPAKKHIIDGLTEDVEIAEHLATKFHKICQPNSSIKNKYLQEEFEKQMLTYKGATKNPILFDINKLAMVVDSMKVGKSPGFDGVTIEHFKFAHPCVLLCLKYLFDLILFSGFVPDDFARGITVPIPKEKNKLGNLTSDDFRAITINPITSKIFECCLMDELSEYLYTDKRQFGFKKRHRL